MFTYIWVFGLCLAAAFSPYIVTYFVQKDFDKWNAKMREEEQRRQNTMFIIKLNEPHR